MNSDPETTADDPGDDVDGGYRPPSVTFLGTLAELTQEKEVGAADGTTFNGLDQAS